MKFYDTRSPFKTVSFKQAIMEGMNSETGGLYMPQSLPRFADALVFKTPPPSFRDIAFETARRFCAEDIPEQDLLGIIVEAFPFLPLVIPIDPTTYVLELHHGPTGAFKDFGARFMAQCMSYFNQKEDKPLHILVATSGDTGGAVGSAFSNLPGITVTILYPNKRVSALQEKQMTTLGKNVTALCVDGSFDDCQALVKKAFSDTQLRTQLRLTSANSINIARLIPQIFYYIHASLTVNARTSYDSKIDNPSIVVSVPSGNAGNLTAGLFAKKMGAPIAGFIVATNVNNTLPEWLFWGDLRKRASIATISNAMDVGNPSNFERIAELYSVDEARNDMVGFWIDDFGTYNAMRACNDNTGYLIDPHGAIAWQAWATMKGSLFLPQSSAFAVPGLHFPENTPPSWYRTPNKVVGLVLETAHPAKFADTVKKAVGKEPSMPNRLEDVLSRPSRKIAIQNSYDMLKSYLLQR